MSRRLTVAALLYVAVMVVLGAVATWPVYEELNFIAVAAVAAMAGGATGVLSRRYKWNWWMTTLVLLAAFIVIALGLAIPARWASGDVFPGALIDVVTGPVTGWKDLITSPLPVGTYRNLLVPAVAVFLIAPFAAVRLGPKGSSLAALAVPAAALMSVFGLLFGRTATSAPVQIGPLTLTAPLEMATGSLGVIASVVWLAWRAREKRRAALRRAEEATVVRAVAHPRKGAAAARIGMAVGMVIVALIAGVAVTPGVAESRTRDVLRTSIGPDLSVTEALSPLATYRENFRDTAYDGVLFRVSSEQELPERIRIATLAWYDGEVYRTAAGESNAFQRVPSVLPTPPGKMSTVRFDIGTHTSVWLPTFGSLSHIDFLGADATDMADRFYYDRTTGTAVEAGGAVTGQSYTVTAVVPPVSDVQQARAPGAAPEVEIPESLRTWVDTLGVAEDGAGLTTAIETLRQRGYLSHALRLGDGATPMWMSDLGGYAFRSSAAGHSVARVDTLFTQLTERAAQAETEVGDSSLVAAVGDDEQFAVAGALIAQYLGFPSRVVVGVRTTSESLPACEDGVCTGADVSAWIEVDTGDGQWAAIDTTPQHTESVQTQARQQRDPENVTDVRPRTAEEVSPPDPQGAESESTDEEKETAADLGAVWEAIRWVGIGALGLLILIGPFLTVLVAKLLRRRRRRSDPDAARAIAGGWEEYVDTAVDGGNEAPGVKTRSEVARGYGTTHGEHLAVLADRAIFSDAPAATEEANEFWKIVTAERRELRSGMGWWARVRSALSLTSFTRLFTRRGYRKASPAQARRTERRQRRTDGA